VNVEGAQRVRAWTWTWTGEEVVSASVCVQCDK
jgi:hypothetical protein